MQAIAGDLPGYEEATRALFADDLSALRERISAWPEDDWFCFLRLASGLVGCTAAFERYVTERYFLVQPLISGK